MVKLLFQDIETCVLNNGLTSGFFKPQRGVRQGCPLSPTLFILVAEVLAVLIRTNPKIKGIPINGQERKISQFADDLTCFVRDANSLTELLRVLDSFATLSGLRINKDKSQILCPSNSMFTGSTELMDIPIVQEAKILGIFFRAGASPEDQYRLNFKKPLSRIKQICSSWSNRQLTLKGKVTVANALLISLLQYPCSVISTPPCVVTEYKGIISSFLWDGKRPKIAYKTLILPIESGGLKLIDLHTRLMVNQLQLLRRTLSKPQSHIYAFLSHLTGSSDLPSYFSSKPSIHQNWLLRSKFYADVYKLWHTFHVFQPEGETGVRGEMIWNNQWITSAGATLHWQEWEQAGISRINDICHHSESRTLSHQEIEAKYEIQSSFLDSLMLRLSIPSHWRETLSNRQVDEEDLPPPLEVRFPSGKKEDLLSLSPKKMYTMLVEVQLPTCTAFNTWGREVEAITIEGPEQWTETCTGVYKATRETKLQSFHYKVIHRIIPCNVFLKQIKIKDSEWCRYCDESDTIVHFLFSCQKVRPFWKAISSWFRDADDLYLDRLTPAEYIWGLPSTAHRAPLINAVLLYVKHYIFRQKLFHDFNFELLGWLMEFRAKLRSEEYICKRTGQSKRFDKWRNIYRALAP